VRYLSIAVVVGAAACQSIIEPEAPLPPDAVSTSPLASYATWYAQTETCTGVKGAFTRVRWYSVPGERWWDPRWQQYAIGTWRSPHDIYIASTHVRSEFVVKHEIVRDLLQGGTSDDPRFERCSHIGH